MSETTLTSPEFRPSPLAKAIRDLCEPGGVEHRCSECMNLAPWGEPTCGNVECLESLRAAMYEDVEEDA